MNAHHAQKDTTVSLQDVQMKQDSVNKATSASKVQPASSRRSVQLGNIVLWALIHPKIAPWEPILMQLASGRQSNAETVQLAHTALNQGGRTPQDLAGLDITALLDPVWIMLYHVQLVCIVLRVRIELVY